MKTAFALICIAWFVLGFCIQDMLNRPALMSTCPAGKLCLCPDLGGLTIIPKADRLDKIPKADTRRILAREFSI